MLDREGPDTVGEEGEVIHLIYILLKQHIQPRIMEN